MSQTVAEYLVKVNGDSSGAEKAADTTERRFGGLQDKLGGWGKKLTGQAALSAMSFVGLTGPILGVGWKMVDSASAQEEALFKVGAVYGDNKKTITDWSESAATSLGITRTEALDTAGTFGNIYTSMGFTQQQAGDMSMQFIGLAADLGAFNDVPTPQALQAIQSGLVGEYEPLKRFGVLVNEDKVKMKALEMGLGDANGTLTEQEKVLARQALIWEQTSNAHGNFADTSDGLSMSMKILRATVGDLSAELGQVMLPIATKVAAGMLKFVQVLSNMSPTMKTIVVVIGAFMAALGPILMIVSAMLPALGLLGGLFTSLAGAIAGAGGALAILTGPVGLVIAALVALGVAYKTNFLGFGDGVRAVVSAIGGAISSLVTKFKQVKVHFDMLTQITDPVTAALTALTRVFPGVTRYINPLISGVSKLKNAFSSVKSFITDFTDQFGKFKAHGLDPVSAAVRALGEVFGPFRSHVTTVLVAVDKLKEGFTNVKKAISSFLDGNFSEGFSKLKEGFLSIFDGIGDIGGVIKDMLALIDWAGLWTDAKEKARAAFDAIKDTVSDAVSGVLDAFRNIDWGAVWEGAKDIAGSVVSKLGDLAGAVWGWIQNAAASIDWSALVSGAADIVTGLSSKLGDLGAWAVKWVTDAAGRIDWFGLLSSATNIVTGLSAKLGDLGAWAVKWVSDAAGGVDWFGLLAKATDIVTGLSSKLGDLGAWAKKWVTDAASGVDWKALLSTATDIVTGLSSKLGDLGAWAIKWVTDAGKRVNWRELLSKASNIVTGLSSKLGDLGAWVLKWISDAVPSTEDWKSLIGNVSDVTSFIVDGLGDLGSALLGWVQDAWNGATGWLEDTASKFDPRGWFGGDDSGDDKPKEINDTAGALPKTTKWNASGYVKGINDAIVSAIGAMSGEAIAGAMENWLWRAVGLMPGKITDDMKALAVHVDTAAGTAFGSMSGASLSTSIVGWFTKAVALVGPLLTAPMKTVAVSMDTAFVSAFAGFSGASAGGAITGWLTKAVSLAAQNLTILDTLKTRFQSFTTETQSGLTTWSQQVSSTTTTTLTGIKNTVGMNLTEAGRVIQSFTASATDTMTSWGTRMVNTVTGAMGQARTSVASGGQEMASTMTSVMNQIAGAADRGMSNLRMFVRGAVGEIPGIIASVGGSAVDTAYRIGANISDAFARGMRSALGQIEYAAGQMVRAADRALVAKAQIASPSKLFRGRGKNSGGSYGIGILDMIPEVMKATRDLVSAATPVAVDFASSLGFDREGLQEWARATFSGSPSVDYRMTPNIASPARLALPGDNPGNVYVVMTRSELVDLFDTVDAVKVLTDETEIVATFGG